MDTLSNIDNSTPSQRFAALEIQIKNRTKILELIRKWHLGANDPTVSTSMMMNHHQSSAKKPPASSLSVTSPPSSPPTELTATPTNSKLQNETKDNRSVLNNTPPDQQRNFQDSAATNDGQEEISSVGDQSGPLDFAGPPAFCRLSSLFFGCMNVSRNQLCEWFQSSEDRINLTKSMFHYGMGVGSLLSDISLSSSPAAEFLFHLFELHLEIQLDSTATHQLPPVRMLNQRSLRKDREERLGENAAAALRPAPRHLDKEKSRPARFASDSFMFHEANRKELLVPTNSLDYFSVCLGFVQTMLLCYRRLLDTELVRNSMAVKRFAQFDEELEEQVMKPLFKELRALVDYLLNHAESEMMSALASM